MGRVDGVQSVRSGSPTPAPTPEYKYAVTANSPTAAELKTIAQKDPHLAQTLQRAQATFGDLSTRGGRVTVTTSAGNGGRPVVTVVPPGFDPNKPAKVQTHYHGDRTAAAEPGGMAAAAMKEIMAADPQRVFVLPEANGNVRASGTDWSNVSDQAQTTRDALRDAGVTKVGEKTVSAHSAGGRALAGALKNGKIDADRVLLLDCLYEPAASQIKAGLTQYGQGVKQIVVARGTNEMSRADDMVKAFPGRATKVVVPSIHGDDPHNSVLRNYLGGTRAPSADVPGRADTFVAR